VSALPNLVIIGAMKCGTTSLHRYLADHPGIHMSDPKELNFFIGGNPAPPLPADPGAAWAAGNWHRGVEWYASHFRSDVAVRGESSPGYTSPAHEAVADRMAAVIPDATLVYLVRDPVDRAIAQYRHHVRQGSEKRPPEVALPDPESQYISRGKYFTRLQPFLDRASRPDLHVVVLEDLLHQPQRTLSRLRHALGLPTGFAAAAPTPLRPRPEVPVGVSADLRDRLRAALKPDADRLRRAFGLQLAPWSV
jgi:hypothetical protein